MASVPLRFIPPDIEGLTTLHIWEAPASTGPFTQIESVGAIGTYPDYIEEHLVTVATSAVDWFAISWVDSLGIETDLSAPIKGGDTTLVGQLIQRVLQRDRTLDKHVIQQEAEAAIQTYFGDSVDPYDPTLIVNYRVLNGLTYMVLARSLMAVFVLSSTSNVSKATVGLVSFESGAQANQKQTLPNIQGLIEMAEKDLGIGGSFVIDMARLCKVYGGPNWAQLRATMFNDQEFSFIPWLPATVETP